MQVINEVKTLLGKRSDENLYLVDGFEYWLRDKDIPGWKRLFNVKTIVPMQAESHIEVLKTEISTLEQIIKDKENHINLLKIGIDIDRKKLEVIKKGVERLRNR